MRGARISQQRLLWLCAGTLNHKRHSIIGCGIPSLSTSAGEVNQISIGCIAAGLLSSSCDRPFLRSLVLCYCCFFEAEKSLLRCVVNSNSTSHLFPASIFYDQTALRLLHCQSRSIAYQELTHSSSTYPRSRAAIHIIHRDTSPIDSILIVLSSHGAFLNAGGLNRSPTVVDVCYPKFI